MQVKNMEFSSATMAALEKLVPELGTQDYAKDARERLSAVDAEIEVLSAKLPAGSLPRKQARTKAEETKLSELREERQVLAHANVSLTRMGRSSLANVVRELVREGLERHGHPTPSVDMEATGRTRKTHASAKGGA